jgi:hypothetical protein
MADLSAFLEKAAKYTKSWTKRFVKFNATQCSMAYGASSEAAAKNTMTVGRLTRSSEKNSNMGAGSNDLYSFIVDGTLGDGKADQWTFRFPDETSFNEWYFHVRDVVAARGDMDPFHFGLPKEDPRVGLPFVHVPAQHLFRFGLLDRAIMYYFGDATVNVGAGSAAASGPDGQALSEVLVIGDRCLYLFKATADLHRCVPISQIRKVYAGSGCLGIAVDKPQHDMLLTGLGGAVARIVDVLEGVHRSIPNSDALEIDTATAAAEALGEFLHLAPRENYRMSLTAPTPKAKLKNAMDLYEKQTGQRFVFGAAAAPAPALPANHAHSPDAIDIGDPMAVMLMKIGLKDYIVPLQRQHLDVDLLSCMDPDDLISFGVNNDNHRQRIIAAAKGEEDDEELAVEMPSEAAAVPRRAFTIVLDSDSDADDLPVTVPVARPINLDADSDDDMPAPQPRPVNVMLDSSDDDMPVPAPKKAPIKVSLDSDDEI